MDYREYGNGSSSSEEIVYGVRRHLFYGVIHLTISVIIRQAKLSI
jgi:hypothetical protein